MDKIYLIICDCGNSCDYDYHYQSVHSAWKNYKDAVSEKERLEKELKEKADTDTNKSNFCAACPLNNYDLSVQEAEALASEYCKNFSKSDLSVDEETFCDNQYQSTSFSDDWYKYTIKEINLN